VSIPAVGSFPLWSVEGGLFQPLPIVPNELARGIREAACSTALPDGADVYLRGSVLEEEKPHPEADLDIVLVSPRVHWQPALTALRQVLMPFGRPLDLLPIEPAALQHVPTIRLLLTTRSMHLRGPRWPLQPVAADKSTVLDHWSRYAPFNLRDLLQSRRERRVCELKLLTRSFAVIEFFRSGRFSRDIGTCLRWACQTDSAAGLELSSYWAALAKNDDLPDMEIDGIRRVFLRKVRHSDH